MAKTEFGGSCERDDTIGRYERQIKKIMLAAARAALDAEGIKYKVDRQGTIRITKQYLKEEKWTSFFSVDTYAIS
ncbi:hypothetical protein LCGC14_1862580, partial [marine sediment metagenome]